LPHGTVSIRWTDQRAHNELKLRIKKWFNPCFRLIIHDAFFINGLREFGGTQRLRYTLRRRISLFPLPSLPPSPFIEISEVIVMARSLTINQEESARVSGLFAAFIGFGVLWMLLTGWSSDVSAAPAVVDAPRNVVSLSQ